MCPSEQNTLTRFCTYPLVQMAQHRHFERMSDEGSLLDLFSQSLLCVGNLIHASIQGIIAAKYFS